MVEFQVFQKLEFPVSSGDIGFMRMSQAGLLLTDLDWVLLPLSNSWIIFII